MHAFSALGRPFIAMVAVIAAFSAAPGLAEGSDQPAGATDQTDLPDSFFRSAPSKETLSVERPAGSVPIFPKMGVRAPKVTVDYFYTHDCLPCAEASRALYAILEERTDLLVVFHPVAVDQAGFDDALAETILYASEPSLFTTYHFGSMAAELSKISLDRSALLADLIKISSDPDGIIGRFEHYQSWATALPLNAETLQTLEADSLPVFVVNEDFYEGFATAEALGEVIEAASVGEAD